MKKINWTTVALVAIIALFVVNLSETNQMLACAILFFGWGIYNMHR